MTKGYITRNCISHFKIFLCRITQLLSKVIKTNPPWILERWLLPASSTKHKSRIMSHKYENIHERVNWTKMFSISLLRTSHSCVARWSVFLKNIYQWNILSFYSASLYWALLTFIHPRIYKYIVTCEILGLNVHVNIILHSSLSLWHIGQVNLRGDGGQFTNIWSRFSAASCTRIHVSMHVQDNVCTLH